MSSIVLYGPPGTGKTTMACTMCDLDYTVHLIDVDFKAKQMVNLKKYIDSGKLLIYPIQHKLVQDSLRNRVLHPANKPTGQPLGYLAICDLISEFEKHPPQDSESKHVIVMDSMSRVEEHLKRLIMYVSGRGAFEQRDWGIIKNNYEELFSTFYALPFKHQIMIFHSQVEEDQITGTKQFKPLLDGQTKDKVGKDVEEMYFCKVDVGKHGATYTVVTKPIGRIQQARTSRNLKVEEPSDFSIIFKEEVAGDPRP